MIMVPSPKGNPCLNGGSSITALLYSIAHKIGMGEMIDQKLPQADTNGDSLVLDKGLPSHTSGIFSLPTRQTADALMLNFWTYIHPIFPLLHRPTTESIYQSLWIPNVELPNGGLGKDGQIQKAILQIVFALSCQSGNHAEAAEYFYYKSREYYSTDTVDSPSLEIVQLLLLTGIYLQSTKYASRCWGVIGSAIRYAQYLGLDLEHPSQEFTFQIEKEMRRRVWYSCVIIDRSVSSHYSVDEFRDHSS